MRFQSNLCRDETEEELLLKAQVAELAALVADGKGDEPAPKAAAPAPAEGAAENGEPAEEAAAEQSENSVAQELEQLEAALARLTTELDDKHKYARGAGARGRSRFE